MTHARGTTNRNSRGSTENRRVRKQWLLTEFGDGTTADCRLRVSPDCQGSVTLTTISVDRFPVPGCEGGTYRRGNIRPACAPCQCRQGGQLGSARRMAKSRIL